MSTALAHVGVTEEHVSAWLGRPCGCGARRQKLNQLSQWAKRVVGGATYRAKEYLEKMVGE